MKSKLDADKNITEEEFLNDCTIFTKKLVKLIDAQKTKLPFNDCFHLILTTVFINFLVAGKENKEIAELVSKAIAAAKLNIEIYKKDKENENQ
jgi:hypothetical protein